MMILHDRRRIRAFLTRNRLLHIYEIGDLGAFFWPKTIWFGLGSESGKPARSGDNSVDSLEEIALLYCGSDLPALLAFSHTGPEHLVILLRSLQPFLPVSFYLHVTPGAEVAFTQDYSCKYHGRHLKMGLTGDLRSGPKTSDIRRLHRRDLPAILELYKVSYPGNWFDPRMIETGYYVGCWSGETLIAIAGVHTVSRRERVAALGNITTHPDFRGRGHGRAVTDTLCRRLREAGFDIGLNVLAANHTAIRIYESLGFTIVTPYDEWMISSTATT
ncbi:MAG: GNAT family N-acetyltransferase [Candidatus Riflebacteria bacterium]|nr:GNAT family N-acetyltransferase [Candidatus Riflebacteria bacterium]